jgi:redox-sensitive bicupin YhaK (pirin superfamily)
MPVPTREMLLAVSHEFYSKWNFPNCIGSIDGKHLWLKCPSKSETVYPIYKHCHSIVLQGFADDQYRFMVIDGGSYGQQSGGRIFCQSSLYHLNSKNFNMPNDKEVPLSDVKLPFVIVEDEAYLLLS